MTSAAGDVPKVPTVRLKGSCGHVFTAAASDVEITHVDSIVVGYSAVCTSCSRPSLTMASPTEISLLLEAGCAVADTALPTTFRPPVVNEHRRLVSARALGERLPAARNDEVSL